MKTLLFLVLLTVQLPAQLKIVVPDTFTIYINEVIKTLDTAWIDSLKNDANHSNIHYQIAGCLTSKFYTITKLRIPQTLTFNQVMRQVIIYYSLLSSEDEMEKETLLIYPFFINTTENEFIKCTYSNKSFYFLKNYWATIHFPSPPTPEDKYIYNQILNQGLNQNSIFDEIPEMAIKEISAQQNKSFEEIMEIFKKVSLWYTIH